MDANRPYEIAVARGAHKGKGGKVLGAQRFGNGRFFLVHFWNSKGELSAPPSRDLIPESFCRVVIAGRHSHGHP